MAAAAWFFTTSDEQAMSQDLVRISKFLSHVLRHKPERIGIALDEAGWTSVDDLLEKANQQGVPLTRERLCAVVRDNDKQRFALSEDGARIRENQGHSVQVDLGLTPRTPPELLYHGTATRFLNAIREQGLLPRRRHHVHLSLDAVTARKVGSRYGKPVVLAVNAGAMHAAGHDFFCSENGIWLTARVAPEYIAFPEG